MNSTLQRVWRRRLIGLRSLLVLCLALALLVLQQIARAPASLEPLLWLAALLLPNLIALASLNTRRQQRLLALELTLDVVIFVGLLQQLGGAGNPLSFYLLVPLLLGALTLGRGAALSLLVVTLGGYLLATLWHSAPPAHSTLHALTRELSHTHGLGMGVVFVALALLLTALGQVIQSLARQQQRQHDRLLELAGRRERLYQVAATLAHQAHELNTPLSSLVMLADNAAREPGLPQSTRDDLAQIEALARRVAARLRNADADSLPERPAYRTLMERVRDHLRHLHPTLALSVSGPEGQCFNDGAAWFRVLANLGYNAIDAGAERLDVRLAALPGGGWLLQVSDDGPDHPERRAEEGLGVGLALVESTLAALGATLTLRFERQWSQARIEWSEHDA
ncbi:MAG: sensor histidine kinase [Pseudomonadota bacterium]|nr:sensor histidine kinase [Pseudomonadota bacterium]